MVWRGGGPRPSDPVRRQRQPGQRGDVDAPARHRRRPHRAGELRGRPVSEHRAFDGFVNEVQALMEPTASQRRPTMSTAEQMQKMKNQPGFIAALDQSGGSTPHALVLYGIKDHSWKDDDEMFELVHQMRTRIITSPSFAGERIIGAILFEDTMDRDVEGQPTADYLWNVKRIVPFLKVDKGLQAEKDGVQLMKSMPELGALLDKGKSKRIFGTKMRSVIKHANRVGIKNIVAQQFQIASQIVTAGLIPIIEPEVDIHCPE